MREMKKKDKNKNKEKEKGKDRSKADTCKHKALKGKKDNTMPCRQP